MLWVYEDWIDIDECVALYMMGAYGEVGTGEPE